MGQFIENACSHELNGVKWWAWRHGGSGIINITNSVDISQLISQRPPNAVVLDGVLPNYSQDARDLFQFGNGRSQKYFDLMSRLKDQDIVVASDFISYSGLAKYSALQKDALITEGLLSLGIGMVGSLDKIVSLIQTIGDKKITRRKFGETVLQISIMSAIVAMGIEGYGNARNIIQTNLINDCNFNSPLFLLPGTQENPEPNFADTFDRTEIVTHKLASIPQSEFMSRGFEPEERTTVFGVGHFSPQMERKLAATFDFDISKRVREILEREAAYLTPVNDRDAVIEAIARLKLLIARSLPLKIVKPNEYTIDLVPIQGPNGNIYVYDPVVFPESKGKTEEQIQDLALKEAEEIVR